MFFDGYLTSFATTNLGGFWSLSLYIYFAIYWCGGCVVSNIKKSYLFKRRTVKSVFFSLLRFVNLPDHKKSNGFNYHDSFNFRIDILYKKTRKFTSTLQSKLSCHFYTDICCKIRNSITRFNRYKRMFLWHY